MLDALLSRNDLTLSQFARRLPCSHTLARRWRDRPELMPDEVREWLERRAEATEAHPPPVAWHRPRFGRAA